MKILITSDNHLGYKETDPVRKEDSFATFEEVLSLAVEEDVDLVLQGGDLFDENKPSRNTYSKTLQILRKYCLGGRRPSIRTSVPLNCSDGNMAVSMPILSIHGNHDDPSGFNSISPLDVIKSTGLINYFGKCGNTDDILVEPVLIEKDCKVAVFGLGYVKDRVLYRAFMRKCVRYRRPEGEGWYNILVVHQNRTPRANEYLPEDFIDPFFDLVVYGHEHESLRLRHRNFDVIQCGSTVRTSLSEGESHEKYVYLLDIGDTAHIRRRQLRTVRPLLMETIKIEAGEPEAIIKGRLTQMLLRAEHLAGRSGEGPPAQEGVHESTAADDDAGSPSRLPLIRLRVEIKGDKAVNRHRLNEFLENRVANPNDVLRILKRPEKMAAKPHSTVQRIGISEIYKELLAGLDLGVLAASRALDAVNDFVHKDSRDSWSSLVRESIEKIVGCIDFDSVVLEDVAGMIRQAKLAFEGAEHIERDDAASHPEDELDAAFDDKDIRLLCGGQAVPACPLSPRAKEPGSLSEVSELSTDPAMQHAGSRDFTFLEEKREAEDIRNMAAQARSAHDPAAKKMRENDSEEELFTFARYL